MITLAIAFLLAQEPQEQPSHDLHVREFAVIWKQIEAKRTELKSYRAELLLSRSESAGDSTTWLTGELLVKREEKEPPLMLWKVGVGGVITQRSLHDGELVTVTDESDAKDLRYRRAAPLDDAELLVQQILLTGGEGLAKQFEISTIMDPGMAKKKRTISTKIEERLDKTDEPAPPPENQVDSYVFTLRPLKAGMGEVTLMLDAQSLRPTMISMRLKSGDVLQAVIRNATRLGAKEIEEKKLFDLPLSDKFTRILE